MRGDGRRAVDGLGGGGESVAIGTVLSIHSPSVAELIARAFDFVWIDLEHGALGLRDMQDLAIGARAGGARTFVRVPSPAAPDLTAVLDAGVDGVVVPMVERPEQAAAITRRMRYPPVGTRGYGPRRGRNYGRDPYRGEEQAPLCLVQIETVAALDAAEAIAAVDGVDALVVGCSDLSFNLGSPLDMSSTALGEAVRHVESAAARNGIAAGIATSAPPATLPEVMTARTTLVAYGADVRFLTTAVDQVRDNLRTLHRDLRLRRSR